MLVRIDLFRFILRFKDWIPFQKHLQFYGMKKGSEYLLKAFLHVLPNQLFLVLQLYLVMKQLNGSALKKTIEIW